MLTPDIPDAAETLDTVRVGYSSDRILKDEAFMEAVRATEQEFLYEWYETEPADVAGRERAHSCVRGLDHIVKRLRVQMDRGEKARAEQE